MNDKYLFHHYDLDGYVGGSIAMASHPDFTPISCSYDNRVKPMDVVKPGDHVLVIDYSFLPDEMKWMKDNCSSFVWIDHHVSALKLAEENGYSDVFGVRNMKYSGAELAWMFLFPDLSMSKFVTGVGEYDTFRNNTKPEFMSEVIPFFLGTQLIMQERLNPANMKDNVMSSYSTGSLLSDLDLLYEQCLKDGKLIAKYNLNRYRAENEESAYVKDLFGLRCLCINATGNDGSLRFNLTGMFDPMKHDMIVIYSYNGKTKKWSYGFYSDGHPEVDCSTIAKELGGGGHRGAAGATSENLIDGLL